MRLAGWLCIVGLVALPATARADALQVTLRGRTLALEHVPALPPAERAAVLYLPGDGGWRGFAITIAREMAADGYDVYGLDTRQYLEAFTGGDTLSVQQIGSDLDSLAAAIRGHRDSRVVLVGWSEGAALVIAAAATRPSAFAGVVAFGVPEQAALAWRLRDSLASLAGREPDEPEFDVAPLLSRVGMIPLAMIQATQDPYTPMDRAQALFNRATAPKRLQFIEARNHRFDGGTSQFFTALRNALGWVEANGSAGSARQAARQP